MSGSWCSRVLPRWWALTKALCQVEELLQLALGEGVLFIPLVLTLHPG